MYVSDKDMLDEYIYGPEVNLVQSRLLRSVTWRVRGKSRSPINVNGIDDGARSFLVTSPLTHNSTLPSTSTLEPKDRQHKRNNVHPNRPGMLALRARAPYILPLFPFR
jgi:hypothetical protein